MSRRYATPTYDKNTTNCCVELSIPKHREGIMRLGIRLILNDLRLAGLK